MPKISAVIITFNEELFIDKCLASLKGIADEIVVVDSYSTDATEEICKKWEIRNVSELIDILGLMGDTADNIPGIPGVG